MRTSYIHNVRHKQKWLTDVWNRIYDALLCSSLIDGVSIYDADYPFNTSFHSSTETTSFKVVYGRDLPSISPSVHGKTGIFYFEELLDHDVMLKILKDNLLMSQT